MLTPQQLLSECVRMAKIAGKISLSFLKRDFVSSLGLFSSIVTKVLSRSNIKHLIPLEINVS